MRKLTVLATAAAAVLVLAAPAVAQEAYSPQTGAAPIRPAPSAEEQALQAAGAAFQADMGALARELEIAKTAAGADAVRANAEADLIVARYQPRADAFADSLAAYAASPAAGLPAERQAEVAAQIATLRTVPAQVRTGVMAAPAAPLAPQ